MIRLPVQAALILSVPGPPFWMTLAVGALRVSAVPGSSM